MTRAKWVALAGVSREGSNMVPGAVERATQWPHRVADSVRFVAACNHGVIGMIGSKRERLPNGSES